MQRAGGAICVLIIAIFILAAPAMAGTTVHEPGEVLVAFDQGVSWERALSAIDQAGARATAAAARRGIADSAFRLRADYPLMRRTTGRTYALVSSALPADELVSVFKAIDEVAAVSLNSLRTFDAVPDDTYFSDLWGLRNTGQEIKGTPGTPGADISAAKAWDSLTQAPDSIIVSLDTGVLYTHEDLRDNMWVNPGEIPNNGIDDDENGYIDDVHGITTGLGPNDPMRGNPLPNQNAENNGHGTHTCGTMAGVGDNGVGVAGVAWSAKIMAISTPENEGLFDSDSIEAISYILEMAARGQNVVAVNASWGGPVYSEVLRLAIASLDDAGVAWCASAGNSARNMDESPAYPGAYDLPNLVSVAATNNQDGLAYFSNYGPGCVMVAAPGENIYSTYTGDFFDPAKGQIFYDDFESGAGNWTASGPAAIGFSAEHSHSPTHSMKVSQQMDGEFNFNHLTLNQPLDLSGYENAPVRAGFYVSDNGFAADIILEYSLDNGQSWEMASSGLPPYQDWAIMTFDLPNPGPIYLLRITIVTASLDEGEMEVFIDDFGVGLFQGNYNWLSGTSMAAPHVTGTMALIGAAFPDESPESRIGRLLSGVDILPSLQGKVNNAGRLNLAKTLDPATPARPYLASISSPTEAVPGRQMIISGLHFGETRGSGSVVFGDQEKEVAAEIDTWSDSEIKAYVPSDAGRYVRVVQNGLASNSRRASRWLQSTLPNSGRDSAAVAVMDSKIYLSGGVNGRFSEFNYTDTFDLYDPATKEWTSLEPMAQARARHASVALDGLIYVIGGNYDEPFGYMTRGDYVDNLAAYDPETNQWTDLGAMPEPLYGHAAVAMDGLIYVIGGANDEEAKKSLYAYNPADGSWTGLAPMSQPRYGLAACAVNGKILAAGGLPESKFDDDPLATAEIYDPATNSWSPAADLPTPVAFSQAAFDGHQATIAGGMTAWVSTQGGDGREWTPFIWRYDPSSDRWTVSKYGLDNLPFPKNSAPLAFVPYYGLYSLGGSMTGPMDGMERYDVYPPAKAANLTLKPTEAGLLATWTNPTADFDGCLVRIKNLQDGQESWHIIGNVNSYLIEGATDPDQWTIEVMTADALGNIDENAPQTGGPSTDSDSGSSCIYNPNATFTPEAALLLAALAIGTLNRLRRKKA